MSQIDFSPVCIWCVLCTGDDIMGCRRSPSTHVSDPCRPVSHAARHSHSHNRRRHDDDGDSGEEGEHGKDDTRVNNDDFDYESWKTFSLDQNTSRSVNDETA